MYAFVLMITASVYEILPTCAIYVDCKVGDTLGNAQKDCNNVCNGRKRAWRFRY